ncbi:hypothetical protein [Desulfospira joergensenii]|uniref:hypothetical protein n=1 Tax=Desulfospira joergensenii TaxID=53329 RepID=UPI0003B5C77A|nr:hypothetical protein [Desulfospira joergensenii]
MTISALKSVCIGVGGSLILAAFCSTFITMEKIFFIMPLFVAFNGAMTGYRLVEALTDRIHNTGLFSFVLGIGGGALTFVAVNAAGSLLPGGWFALGVLDLFVYMIVSGVTSYLGAKLAVRYFKL